MMKLLCLLLTIMPVFAGVITQADSAVDFKRYCGRWYEQARYENWFEKGLDNVYTDYIPLKNGSLRVTNYGMNAQGHLQQASGRAYITGPGTLGVSFVWPYRWFRAPYKILYVTPEYSAALVSGEDKRYLWLLTRDAHPCPSLIQKLLKEAQRRGFNTSALRYTMHQKRKSTAPETNKPG